MIKKLIEQFRKKDQKEVGVRPWGKYTVLLDDERCKVKIIEVLPGKRLSLQSHEKRTEFWTIVEGEGLMTLNNMTFTVKAGEKVKIPVGTKHRIQNISLAPLTFIEVQTGTYFGEDDIVRYDDDFGRV